MFSPTADSVNIKILNAGAWSRSSEKVFVSLPTELEDLIPEVEDFYKKNHSGRKLHWHHLMSNGIVSKTPGSLCTTSHFGSEKPKVVLVLQITFKNEVGQYDLEVTTFQLAVLFAWNQRPRERISFENLKLATELPDAELRRTLWVIPNEKTSELDTHFVLRPTLFSFVPVSGGLSQTQAAGVVI